jgi:hypothetical protein
MWPCIYTRDWVTIKLLKEDLRQIDKLKDTKKLYFFAYLNYDWFCFGSSNTCKYRVGVQCGFLIDWIGVFP